ncbi:Uncharacterised protein [Mycobacterium tuberculosis]|nr:Uncharacterised protein [Mycobacterium tuberculosis]CKV89078.1 Uncharacterised protein [Mycobacterium tuberculosis]
MITQLTRPWQDLPAIFKFLLSQMIRLLLWMMGVVSQSIFRKKQAVLLLRPSLQSFMLEESSAVVDTRFQVVFTGWGRQ